MKTFLANRRQYLLAAAIVLAIALLLLAQAHGATAPVFLILLPIVFIGLLPSPCLLSRVAYMRMGYRPDEPALPSAFQRPPPYLFA